MYTRVVIISTTQASKVKLIIKMFCIALIVVIMLFAHSVTEKLEHVDII